VPTAELTNRGRAPPRESLSRPSLLTILRTTAWLGLLGFGGGVSVLGMIGHLTVLRRRWLTEREFTNTATIAQMLPGGAAANALAHIGPRLRGLPGAIVPCKGFIVPDALMMVALARGGAT